ncbi:MAG TPA: hypothetical protein VNJ54_11400 [Plantibacter sp.]|uniref:hypothetical protein n=1 Tax=Plantibacter sp. TaxID=1871045 RepID=UPI002C7E7D69|nr:hypothetical protein [Plantibacter sp.]
MWLTVSRYPEAWMIGQVVAATAGTGLVTVAALVAAVGGLASGVGGVVLQRRRDTTTARKDYVDGSLAALQAIIDRFTVEDTRLRALNEERLKRIDTLEDEVTEGRALLAACLKKCNDCLKRISRWNGSKRNE